jgi:hypothetical protein
MIPISSAERTTSSARRNPAARSRSAPGVRMITAKDAPLTHFHGLFDGDTIAIAGTPRVAVPRDLDVANAAVSHARKTGPS